MSINTGEVKAELLAWLDLFTHYTNGVFSHCAQNTLDDFRTKLQQSEPLVTKHLLSIVGDGQMEIGSFGVRQRIAYRDLLATAVLGGNNEAPINFADYKDIVPALLNRAIGIIDTGLWPQTEVHPVLKIKDEALRKRCGDLLSAPGQFDRVVREATLVLEDRLRTSIPHESLSALIPDSADQSGENLANRILSPSNPVLFISTDQRERAAFHKMILGVFSYLRNPSHHHIDDAVEWSWSWSIVGLIDHLIYELGSCVESR